MACSKEYLSFTRTDEFSESNAKRSLQFKRDHKFADFEINIKGKCIPCHRFVLATNSPFLERIFTNKSKANEKEVHLDHLNVASMQITLEYMYTGKIHFHREHLLNFCIISDYLLMAELRERCLAEAPNVLEQSDVFAWLDLAYRQKLDDIKCKCEELIVVEFEGISKTNEFLSFSYKDVLLLLTGIYHNANIKKPDDVLIAAMRWISIDSESRLQYMEAIFNLIHLKKCSIETITEVMQTYKQLFDHKPEVHNCFYALSDLSRDLLNKSKPIPCLLVIGGQVGPAGRKRASNICWSVDPSNQTTSIISAIPLARFRIQHSVCKTPGGFIVTGGYNCAKCIMYSAESNSWHNLPNMQSKRWAHASLFVNGVLFILGGASNYSQAKSKKAEYLAIENGMWQRAADIPVTVSFAKIADFDGNIYLLDDGIDSPLLKLNVAQNIWHHRAPFPKDVNSSYNGFSMTAAQGKLFVAGGGANICAYYDPTPDTWSLMQQTLHRHWYGALVSHNNKLLLLGGSYNIDQAEVEEYDMDSKTWTTCDYRLPAKLYSHHAMVLDLPPNLLQHIE